MRTDSALKLAAHQAKVSKVVLASFRANHRKLAYDMAGEMRSMVSGTVSTAELRRRGHPFGRRGGRTTLTLTNSQSGARSRHRGRPGRVPTPLLPINKQTGQLARSLRIIPEGGIGLQSFRVQFTSPHAIVLRKGGTRRMVARGYWPEVKRRFIPRNKQTIYKSRLDQLRAIYAG